MAHVAPYSPCDAGPELRKKFEGAIEAAETFIGGRAKFMHAWRRRQLLGHRQSGTHGKAVVMALLQRHGSERHSTVRTAVVPNVRRNQLQEHPRRHVARGSTLYSDALKSYEPKTPPRRRRRRRNSMAERRGKVRQGLPTSPWSWSCGDLNSGSVNW